MLGTDDSGSRYARQTSLSHVGQEGQRKLAASSVLVIGAGGLGSPVLMYLAAMGVGRLGVADSDRLELSNMQRQVVHATASIGRSKVDSAIERLVSINPDVVVVGHRERVTAATGWDLLDGYDVVVDCTDNIESRYLISDACVLRCVANVWGGVSQFDGAMTLFPAGGQPCYRCMHPTPAVDSNDGDHVPEGVLGVVPGIVGSMQALEVVKLLLGVGQLSRGVIRVLDGLDGGWRSVALAANPECVACGAEREISRENLGSQTASRVER